MTNAVLYALAVAIWGSTWLAIKFQLGAVPPVVSVVWRFAIAAAITLLIAYVQRAVLRFSLRQHFRIAVAGVPLFGLSYLCVYAGEQFITSGLMALIYSLIVIWTLLGSRLLFGTAITATATAAALLGTAGLALVFWPEIVAVFRGRGNPTGLELGLLGSMLSAAGGLAAAHNERNGIPVFAGMGWAMLYGAIAAAGFAAATRQSFTFDWSAGYLASLAYLTVFGSVIAFAAYLTLQSRVGPYRASYSAVVIPVVALILSTLFEHLEWRMNMIAGVIMCLTGNLLAHLPQPEPSPNPA
ncbi:MAG: EamA family transporter [Alphaproteobacteria bacterium]|nr:EamA family transporter [Alphaproteobacteria bacterium]